MTEKSNIQITIQDSDGEISGTFQAQDNQSIVQWAEENGIKIPTACHKWACWLCKCDVLEWGEVIDVAKLSKPQGTIKRDEETGNPLTVFTCIAGIKTEYFNNNETHHIKLKQRA